MVAQTKAQGSLSRWADVGLSGELSFGTKSRSWAYLLLSAAL